MNIAIAGASGMVGKALTKHLAAKGHTVTALKRDEQGGAAKPFKDVSVESLQNFDAVINLAGENIAAKRWTDEQKKLIIKSRVETTAFLAKTLSQTIGRPSVFINASAIGFYGNRGGEAITESSAAGSGFLATTCQQWEDATLSANRAGLRVVRMRLGVIISKDGGALAKMLLPFQMGAGGNLGSGEQYMSWIAIDDVVKAIDFILQNNIIEGAVNFTAPQPVSNSEFTSTMGKVLSRPAIIPAPAFALKLILGDMAQEMLLEGAKVMPAKLQAAGYEFQYPNLEQALAHEVKK
jgi:uncharacterized protein (TIGR01777 family)